ncbi:MAG: host attachment protein [Candidatus Colwellbacteria bacterium]|nr:host attachment protein [Candidatus Colwellbacteria bacterium]
MKIPEGLPSFDDFSALVIVCGSKSGRIFRVGGGELEEISHIENSKVEYSDKEGFFASSGSGISGGSSPKDDVDKKEEEEFVEKLKKEVSSIIEGGDFKEIYLFAPSYSSREVVDAFPASVRSIIKMMKEGNYVDRHPTEVLGMMRDELS